MKREDFLKRPHLTAFEKEARINNNQEYRISKDFNNPSKCKLSLTTKAISECRIGTFEIWGGKRLKHVNTISVAFLMIRVRKCGQISIGLFWAV